MNKNEAKLAIFDMDGTLVNFSIDSKAARCDAIKFLNAKLGIPDGLLDVGLTTTELVNRAKDYLNCNKKEQPDWTRIRTEIFKIVEVYEDKAAEISTPIDGIMGVLDDLQHEGILAAVCTFNTTRNANNVLARNKMAGYFTLVVGRDNVPDKTKPDPSHGKYILDKLGIQKENACMTGDHPFDIDMAVALGIKGIAISSARHPPADFARFKDITIVNDKEYHLLSRTIKNALRIE